MSQVTQDDALLERLQSGDNAAFRDLIVRYNQRLLIVARAIIGDVFAEDVVQEAWTSIFRAINRFEGRSALSTWMIQIVSNEAKSRLRKEKRHMNVADTEQLPAALAESRFAADGHWQIPPAHWELPSSGSRPRSADERRRRELAASYNVAWGRFSRTPVGVTRTNSAFSQNSGMVVALL